MVRDVSQKIVPNIVTLLVDVIRGQLLLLKREPAHCNLSVLENDLKGWSLLGENYGDSFETVLRTCCERVAQVLRKYCDCVAKHRSVL